eukprot:3167096-Amphidinium_carterae.1
MPSKAECSPTHKSTVRESCASGGMSTLRHTSVDSTVAAVVTAKRVPSVRARLPSGEEEVTPTEVSRVSRHGGSLGASSSSSGAGSSASLSGGGSWV